MIYINNDFIKLIKNAIDANDVILLKDLLNNEIAKILYFDKYKIKEIFRKHNIYYIDDYEKIITAIINNKDKIKNSLEKIIIDNNKVEEKDTKIISKLLTFLDEDCVNNILNKITGIKRAEKYEREFYFDNTIENHAFKSNLKYFLLGGTIIGMVILSISLAYIKKKKDEYDRKLRKMKRYTSIIQNNLETINSNNSKISEKEINKRLEL